MYLDCIRGMCNNVMLNRLMNLFPNIEWFTLQAITYIAKGNTKTYHVIP